MTSFLPGGNVLISVTSISINPTNMTIPSIGSLATITPTVLPANATNKNVAWTSDNPSVATVIGGLVRGVGTGTTTITATTENGGLTAQCLVTVMNVNADATLSDLSANGATVSGFNSNTFTYNMDNVGNTPPTVTATRNNTGATVTITQAEDTNGNEASRTATVVVTAQDGTTKLTYRIIFKKN
jgi:uncharacterized protein YjdB